MIFLPGKRLIIFFLSLLYVFLIQPSAAQTHEVPISDPAHMEIIEKEVEIAPGVRFSVADVDFVQRQDEAEFNRRRARAQEILQKR